MSHPSLRTAQGGISLILDVVSEKHSILARSVFVLHGHRLCRDIAVVLISSIAIWISDISLSFTVRLETGVSQDLKYGEYRMIGSGATVQSVHDVYWSRRLFVYSTIE